MSFAQNRLPRLKSMDLGAYPPSSGLSCIQHQGGATISAAKFRRCHEVTKT
jgi:hypothetical protein